MLVEGCFAEGGLKCLLRLFSEQLYSLEGIKKSRVGVFGGDTFVFHFIKSWFINEVNDNIE